MKRKDLLLTFYSRVIRHLTSLSLDQTPFAIESTEIRSTMPAEQNNNTLVLHIRGLFMDRLRRLNKEGWGLAYQARTTAMPNTPTHRNHCRQVRRTKRPTHSEIRHDAHGVQHFQRHFRGVISAKGIAQLRDELTFETTATLEIHKRSILFMCIFL